jgi:hypothetical protein
MTIVTHKKIYYLTYILDEEASHEEAMTYVALSPFIVIVKFLYSKKIVTGPVTVWSLHI